jgi:hypothetical protein
LGGITTKLHPSLDEQDNDSGCCASSTTELIIENESAGVQIGPLTKIE